MCASTFGPDTTCLYTSQAWDVDEKLHVLDLLMQIQVDHLLIALCAAIGKPAVANLQWSLL